jgi:YcaO-like protein with predicted kinase domain
MTLGPETFVPTPVVSDSGHARSFEETERWLAPLLRRVPITRVVNATPLDWVGLPVWSAVTPLARDLTVHAGKGRHDLAARLSAVMEAIERASAEAAPPGSTVEATFEALAQSEAALDPRIFDLPFETKYRPDRPISWVKAYDLLQRSQAWVALDLVLSPPTGAVCETVETNGLASGNTITEAVVHALYELVERDAASISSFCDLYADPTDAGPPPVRMIDTATLPPDSRAFAERLERGGLALRVRDLTTDTRVAVFHALVVDREFPGQSGTTITFDGYGADLDPARAVLRSITEAIQAHTMVALGSRDDYEGEGPSERSHRLVRQLEALHPTRTVPFPQAEQLPGRDLLDDLHRLLERLTAVGLRRCLVVDLTRPDLEVPVVRVLVPGLSAPYGISARRPSTRLLRYLVR